MDGGIKKLVLWCTTLVSTKALLLLEDLTGADIFSNHQEINRFPATVKIDMVIKKD